MTDGKDIVISMTSTPQMGALNKKPPHLILMKSEKAKTTVPEKFITTDKPDLGTHGFVQAKGIFTDASEETISNTFADILGQADKDALVEMMFPNHRIISIRNLVFRAK